MKLRPTTYIHSKLKDTKQLGFPASGFSSILLIFIVLCLVTLAVLSLVTSQSDYRISQRAAHRTTSYYNAVNTAQQWIDQVDLTLSNFYNASNNCDEYYARVQNAYLSSTTYSIDSEQIYLQMDFPIDKDQYIHVSLGLHYPRPDDQVLYTVNSWTIKNINTIEDYDYDYNLLGTQP